MEASRIEYQESRRLPAFCFLGDTDYWHWRTTTPVTSPLDGVGMA